MSGAYAYCRREPGYIRRDGLPARPVLDEELEWHWRIFYQGTEDSGSFLNLGAYLDWMSRWYERKASAGDLTPETEQLDDPLFLEGASVCGSTD